MGISPITGADFSTDCVTYPLPTSIDYYIVFSQKVLTAGLL